MHKHTIKHAAAEYRTLIDEDDSLWLMEISPGLYKLTSASNSKPAPKFKDLADSFYVAAPHQRKYAAMPNHWTGPDYLRYALEVLQSQLQYISGIAYLRNNLSGGQRHPTLLVYVPFEKVDDLKPTFALILVNLDHVRPNSPPESSGVGLFQGGVIFGSDD